MCVPKKKKKENTCVSIQTATAFAAYTPRRVFIGTTLCLETPDPPHPCSSPPPSASYGIAPPPYTPYSDTRENSFFYSPQPHLVEQMIRVSDILVFCILVPPSPPPALLTNPPTPPPNPSMIFRLFIP